MLGDYGMIEHCGQCEHIKAFGEHKPGLAHSEKCRERLVQCLKDTEDGLARLREVDARIDQGISRILEQQGKPEGALPTPAEDALRRAEELVQSTREREMELRYMHEMHAETTGIPNADTDMQPAQDNEIFQILAVLGAHDGKGHAREHKSAMNKVISEL